jgi:hypothetical protein
MWPFRKRRLVPLDCGLNTALKLKDFDLYQELSHLSVGRFWPQWKRVHPEDFPQGGLTPVSAAAVTFLYRNVRR